MVELIAAVLTTAAVTAGSIAEERQRRTIAYLFATQITNTELILEKPASRVVLVGFLLLTAAPILFATLLFSGVSVEQLLQLAVTTAATVVTSAAVSLVLSIWTSPPRIAIQRPFLLLIALLLGPPAFFAVSFGLRPSAIAKVVIDLLHFFSAASSCGQLVFFAS